MLAFVLDITQNKPSNSKESENDEVKQYMDYQRKLNHINLVKHSLEHVKNQLQENIDSSESEKLSQFLKDIFPISHQLNNFSFIFRTSISIIACPLFYIIFNNIIVIYFICENTINNFYY